MNQPKTKRELAEAGLKPVKHAGQNFLISEEIIGKIISAAKIKKGETILEAGPGTGNLTEALLSAGAKVIAVEKDRNLSQMLISNFQFPISNKKLKVLNEDILGFNETTIKKSYRIIANIPYYLTGQLIQKFLLSRNKPMEMILMVQKEVGERITAKPPKMNYLAALVQSAAKTEILFGVSKDNFWPKPKVDSVVIKLIPVPATPDPHTASMRSHARCMFKIKDNKDNKDKNNIDKNNIDKNNTEFIEFLRIVFKRPRQALFNNLRRGGVKNAGEIIDQLDLPKNVRGQNLNIKQLQALSKSLLNSKNQIPNPK